MALKGEILYLPNIRWELPYNYLKTREVTLQSHSKVNMSYIYTTEQTQGLQKCTDCNFVQVYSDYQLASHLPVRKSWNEAILPYHCSVSDTPHKRILITILLALPKYRQTSYNYRCKKWASKA
jgi:hypothetical protein